MEWVLELRSLPLTYLFKGFTWLGEESFFLLFLPLGYWVIKRDMFARVGAVFLFTVMLNVTLKAVFQIPRPSSIPHLVSAGGWSFPSGHAQTAAVLWGWLAWEIRRPWAYWVGAVLIVGIAFSRVYLGVHYPSDVIAGALIGLLTLIAYHYLLKWKVYGWQVLGPTRQSVILLILLVAFFKLSPATDPILVRSGAALLGLLGGYWHLKYLPPATSKQTISRTAILVLLGYFGLVSIKVGLKAGFGALGYQTAMATFIRYACLGAWISFGLPGLATKWDGALAKPSH